MDNRIFKARTLNGLLLITLILFFEIGPAYGEIVFRKSEADKSSVNVKKAYDYDTCYKGKSTTFVDMQKKPLLIIPDNQLANISLSYKTCIDTSNVILRIDLKKDFRRKSVKFATKYIGQSVALFINGDLVSAVTISTPFESGFSFGCLSYEKAVAIVINSGFTPNYEETCVGGKTKMVNLIKKYKFKEDYTRKENGYPSTLKNSEFWYLKEETPMYDNPNGNINVSIPAKEIIEQYYDSKSEEFERKGNWLKVIYHGETGWIKRNHLIITFFSLLDSNLFLQKFFPFSEYRYDEFIGNKNVYSDYLIKRAATVRKLYIEEALQRFKNKNEFKRWYFDTFNKSFME